MSKPLTPSKLKEYLDRLDEAMLNALTTGGWSDGNMTLSYKYNQDLYYCPTCYVRYIEAHTPDSSIKICPSGHVRPIIESLV